MAAKRTTVLTLARSGGVAGIRPPPLVLDTARVPEKVLRRIESLVETSGFFSLPAELPAPKNTADHLLHSLTVAHADGREHTVTFAEGSASEALRELKRLVRDQSASV